MNRTTEARAAALTAAALGLAMTAGMLSGFTDVGGHPDPEPQAAPVAPVARVTPPAPTPLAMSPVEAVSGRAIDPCLPALATTILCPSEPFEVPKADTRLAWAFAYQTGVTPPTFRMMPVGRRITAPVLHP